MGARQRRKTPASARRAARVAKSGHRMNVDSSQVPARRARCDDPQLEKYNPRWYKREQRTSKKKYSGHECLTHRTPKYLHHCSACSSASLRFKFFYPTFHRRPVRTEQSLNMYDNLQRSPRDVPRLRPIVHIIHPPLQCHLSPLP